MKYSASHIKLILLQVDLALDTLIYEIDTVGSAESKQINGALKRIKNLYQPVLIFEDAPHRDCAPCKRCRESKS